MRTARVSCLPAATTEDQLRKYFTDLKPNLPLAVGPHSILFIKTDTKGDNKIAMVTFRNDQSFKIALELPLPDRLVGGRIVHIDDDFLGFTVLSEGSEGAFGALVDVIILHGLNGHPIHSFEYADQETSFMWLRDHLPRQLPAARILVYGYKAKVATDIASDRLESYSNTFLEGLVHVRADDGSRSAESRPIILLGHSMGGLVIKQALLLANTRADGRYNDILESVAGIVFMGTPHSGAAAGIAEQIIATVLPHHLDRHNSILFDLTNAFKEIIEKHDIQIATLFETKAPDGKPTVVVAEQSAILGVAGERKVGINADHLNLCKFRHQGDSSLDATMQAVKELYREALPRIKARPTSTQPKPPEDLIYVCLPDELPSGLYPVLVVGKYTYWALSHTDSRINGMTILAYDKQKRLVGMWPKTGARFVHHIEYDADTRVVTFFGECSRSVVFPLDKLKVMGSLSM